MCREKIQLLSFIFKETNRITSGPMKNTSTTGCERLRVQSCEEWWKANMGRMEKSLLIVILDALHFQQLLFGRGKKRREVRVTSS